MTSKRKGAGRHQLGMGVGLNLNKGLNNDINNKINKSVNNYNKSDNWYQILS